MMNSQKQKGKKISILGFAGSLRKDSFNKSLLRAARGVLKETRRDYSGWFWRGLKARALRWRSFIFFIISPDKQKQPPYTFVHRRQSLLKRP